MAPERILNFINGEYQPALSGEWMNHIAPSTGAADYQLPSSGQEDVEAAVKAAKEAFSGWAALSQEKRSGVLFKVAEILEARSDEFARAESEDQGKPVWLARDMDIARAISNFKYFAGHMLHRYEQSSSHGPGLLNYTLRKPMGVAGLISPWNLPLYLLSWKAAPALACGNTVVAKPSEFTSRTAFMLCEVLKEAGVPPGVFNLVLGEGSRAGQALVEHPDVPLISFTGGTKTGAAIAQSAAPKMKKLSLELGGKNPNILFASCDLKKAIRATVRSSFLNQGEICLCGSRVFVQREISNDFVEGMKSEISKLPVGDPADAKIYMGPLVSEQHKAKVQSYIDLAKSEGAEVFSQELRLSEKLSGGHFVAPTMILGLSPESRCSQEEIFGPVITVHPFETEQEVIEHANSVRYGLSASVYTGDVSQAHRVAESLDVGTVWINTWLSRDLRVPFGGVKDSGRGREGGDYSVDFFTEVKTVCLKFDDRSR